MSNFAFCHSMLGSSLSQRVSSSINWQFRQSQCSAQIELRAAQLYDPGGTALIHVVPNIVFTRQCHTLQRCKRAVSGAGRNSYSRAQSNVLCGHVKGGREAEVSGKVCSVEVELAGGIRARPELMAQRSDIRSDHGFLSPSFCHSRCIWLNVLPFQASC
jgi:hypothetical protein